MMICQTNRSAAVNIHKAHYRIRRNLMAFLLALLVYQAAGCEPAQQVVDEVSRPAGR